MTVAVRLPRLGLFAAWRHAARRLVRDGVAADEIEWLVGDEEPSLFARELVFDIAQGQKSTQELSVPKAFVALAEQVSCARHPGALSDLYKMLGRLHGGRGRLADRSDPLAARLQEIAKNVRHDRHKMRAFVRFREIEGHADRRRFVAWFEPDHRIEELNAPFFARRFNDMDWAIVTPEVTTRHIGGVTTFEAIQSADPGHTDATEELWTTYFSNIFNPARLKVKAMTSEMPKKYWKNLPEAAAIPGLIADAEARVRKMRDAGPSLPHPLAAKVEVPVREVLPPATDIDALAREAATCTRCDLCRHATQTVFGEGPETARLMVVGEQPGDQEDLAGRPFVGPAGQLFDRLAHEAGLDRSAVYVTNAVKHFKFTPRGKRRIHARPDVSEIETCRWWLDREISLIKPVLTLAMGASAAHALTGSGKGVTKRRGRIETGLHGGPVLITLHPSYLLRVPDQSAKALATEQFRGDLARAAASLSSAEIAH